MSNIKPSSHGIVVDHKESEVRYAVSDINYNEKVHRKVRDLRPGETVRGFSPLRKEPLGDQGTPAPTQDAAGDPSDSSATPGKTSA